jgi:glycosyltransferase involved in cell wall biosynthesis
MMREGAKLASYRLLASALGRLADLPWELTVIGDGPAREAVERALSALGPERVRFEGRLDRPALARTLAACDIFAWPAIGEAFGMALLEAQACGLPVVAGNAGGVAAVVGAGGRLVPEGDVEAFAQALRGLIVDVPLRRSMGRAARARILARHDLQAAANELAAWLAAIATSSHPRLGTP